MTSWQKALDLWLQTHSETISDELVKLRRRFVAKFPPQSLPSLTLDQYALGHTKSRDSYCYWLEWRTQRLGSVLGGSSRKWGVWGDGKKRKWTFTKDFSSPDQALASLTGGLLSLVEAVLHGRIDELDEIGAQKLGRNRIVLRLKPLSLYFPNHFLPIFNVDHLAGFLRKFAQTPVDGAVARNLQLLDYMRQQSEFSSFDTVQMANFLYDWANPSKPPIRQKNAFELRFKQFVCLVQTDEYASEFRRDCDTIPHALGIYLHDAVMQDPDFAEVFEHAILRCRTSLNNLSGEPIVDGFLAFLRSTTSGSLSRLFTDLLDESKALSSRIERFIRSIDLESENLIVDNGPGDLRIPDSLPTIVLSARYPDKYMPFRNHIVDDACDHWGMEQPDAGIDWFVHFMYWAEPLLDALKVRRKKEKSLKGDWIDVHLLLWFNHRFDADFAHRFGEDAAGNPVLLPEPPSPLRALYEATRRTQTIALCGPPGTGKTRLARHFVTHWLLSSNHSQADADAYWVAVDTGNTAAINQYTAQAWHQRPGTGDFAITIALDEWIRFEDVVERSAAGQAGAVAGPLRRICERAAADWRALGATAPSYALLLEHLERADLAAVLGNVLPLVDTDCRLGMPDARDVRLPYSGKLLGVPPNLLVLGTLDGAVAIPPATDAALRRRFTFVALSPAPDALSETPLGATDDINLAELLTVLNERLAATKGRTVQLGHHLLLDVRTIDDLRQAWYNRIVPQVRAWFTAEEEKLTQILGDTFVERRSTRPRWQAALSVPPDTLPSTYEIRILDRDEFRWAIQELAAGGA